MADLSSLYLSQVSRQWYDFKKLRLRLYDPNFFYLETNPTRYYRKSTEFSIKSSWNFSLIKTKHNFFLDEFYKIPQYKISRKFFYSEPGSVMRGKNRRTDGETRRGQYYLFATLRTVLKPGNWGTSKICSLTQHDNLHLQKHVAPVTVAEHLDTTRMQA
jgi:hypothetical protein